MDIGFIGLAQGRPRDLRDVEAIDIYLKAQMSGRSE